MKIDYLSVHNFKGAFRGMRNPMNSWDRSDSIFDLYDWNDADDALYEIAYAWAENEKENPDEELIGQYVDWLQEICNLRYADYTSYISDLALIGPKDLELAQKLIRGGTEHRKFLRQIMISFDLTAPLYW